MQPNGELFMDKLGVTATELFSNNPYRVLGIPVNATIEEIEERYELLCEMCEDGTIDEFSSEYDATYLPPIRRDIENITASRDKVLSNGYRAFAYADSVYAYDPSQTDVNIHVDNIDCYDCFLNCYIWLVLHDQNIMYKSMWFKLAKYIDDLICSDPTDWGKLFDNRYPTDVYQNDFDTIYAFHSTFCEIILLPLKELVKGSMECQSAVEVLSVRMFEDFGEEGDDLQALSEKAEEAAKHSKKNSSRNPSMKGISLTEAYLAEQRMLEDDENYSPEGSISLVEGLDEENIYNETLMHMLKANKSRNQVIKSLNTDATYGGGNLGKEDDAKLTMQTVNTSVADEKLLRSPYGLDPEELTLEEKYSDVNINDMLNPTLPYSSSTRDLFSNADSNEFEENKVSQRNGQILFIVILVLFVLGIGAYLGYMHWDKISEWINDLLF